MKDVSQIPPLSKPYVLEQKQTVPECSSGIYSIILWNSCACMYLKFLVDEKIKGWHPSLGGVPKL